MMMVAAGTITILLLLAASVASSADYIYNIRGNMSFASKEDGSSILVTGRLTIPPPGKDSQRHSDVVIQGSLNNPNSTHFNDRLEFHYDGDDYLAILTESSLLVQRKEGSSWVYYTSVPHPGGCEATSIQDDGDGYFHVLSSTCPPWLVDAYDFSTQGNPLLRSKGKVLVVEGVNEANFQRALYYVYLDQGSLVSQFPGDGSGSTISPNQIGSCSELRDIHQFSRLSTDGSHLEVLVDCSSASGTPFRYLLAYSSRGNISRLIPIHPNGVPLSDGRRYIASAEGRSVYLTDTNNPESPAVERVFPTPAPVDQIKFLTSENFTKLVVQRTGQDVVMIDAAEFIASNGREGEYVEPNTTVQSCHPTCPEIELMGDSFVMMTLWNTTSSHYDVLYRPLDFTSATPPVRILRVSSQPILLSFVQTSLEVVDITTPPTTPSTPASDSLPSAVVLALAIGIPVGLVLVGCLLCCFLIYCLWLRKLRRKNRSLESDGAESYDDPQPYTSTVYRDPHQPAVVRVEAMELREIPIVVSARQPSPQHQTSAQPDAPETQSPAEPDSDAIETSQPSLPPAEPELDAPLPAEPEPDAIPRRPIQETQEEGTHEIQPRPVSSASSGTDEGVLPSISLPLHLRVRQETQEPDSGVHSLASSRTSIPNRSPSVSPNASMRRANTHLTPTIRVSSHN